MVCWWNRYVYDFLSLAVTAPPVRGLRPQYGSPEEPNSARPPPRKNPATSTVTASPTPTTSQVIMHFNNYKQIQPTLQQKHQKLHHNVNIKNTPKMSWEKHEIAAHFCHCANMATQIWQPTPGMLVTLVLKKKHIHCPHVLFRLISLTIAKRVGENKML